MSLLHATASQRAPSAVRIRMSMGSPPRTVACTGNSGPILAPRFRTGDPWSPQPGTGSSATHQQALYVYHPLLNHTPSPVSCPHRHLLLHLHPPPRPPARIYPDPIGRRRAASRSIYGSPKRESPDLCSGVPAP